MRTVFKVPVFVRALCAALALAGATSALAIAGPASFAKTPSFAGVPWGSSPDVVKQTLVAKGYIFDHTDKDHDMWFHGVLANSPQIAEIFSPTGLVKTMVHFQTSDDDCESTYAQLLDELKQKYGAPSSSVENYVDPFKKGDGHFKTAVGSGKASLHAIWSPAAQSTGGVALEVDQGLTVYLVYESAAWNNEAGRRAKKSEKSDL